MTAHTKHCKQMRQPCPQPYRCANGCYSTPHDRAAAEHFSQDFHADPSYPVASFDGFWTWLSDAVGTFASVNDLFNHEPPGWGRAYLVCIFGAVGFGLYRYFF